ncbi:MAG: xylulokinase [Anaerolineales bacterium]|jgi:xylulokinase
MSYFIGIDSSTTATKALLMDEAGKIISIASSEYSYETPHPLWSEQSPHLWWDATVESIRKIVKESGVDPGEVKGIGLTGQMHGAVFLDENGEVLRPAILWNDQRTADQCNQIRERLGKENLIRITGNDALTGFTAPKILWFQQEEPEVYRKLAQILLPKDYVRFRLTGEYGTDRAGGAGTLLFDLEQRDWSQEVLKALDISPNLLPKTYEGTDITGVVSAEAAKATGLAQGTPVMAGGGDQAAAAVGTGAVEQGIVSLSLGTSGVVFVTMDHAAVEPDGRLHAFCHAVPGKWHFMGVMLSAGGSLRWHRDTFFPDAKYDTLMESILKVPVGADGLYFLPYLTGERTPHPDPLARGAFVGLTVRHTLPHMTRAVIEGVSFGLRDSFELMKAAGLKNISQVRVTGGGAQSPIWRQILADVFNVDIITVNSEEGAAYGAATLAAVGSGLYPDVAAACRDFISVTGSVSPTDAVAHYDRHYAVYRDLYPALKSTFAAIAAAID